MQITDCLGSVINWHCSSLPLSPTLRQQAEGLKGCPQSPHLPSPGREFSCPVHLAFAALLQNTEAGKVECTPAKLHSRNGCHEHNTYKGGTVVKHAQQMSLWNLTSRVFIHVQKRNSAQRGGHGVVASRCAIMFPLGTCPGTCSMHLC